MRVDQRPGRRWTRPADDFEQRDQHVLDDVLNFVVVAGLLDQQRQHLVEEVLEMPARCSSGVSSSPERCPFCEPSSTPILHTRPARIPEVRRPRIARRGAGPSGPDRRRQRSGCQTGRGRGPENATAWPGMWLARHRAHQLPLGDDAGRAGGRIGLERVAEVEAAGADARSAGCSGPSAAPCPRSPAPGTAAPAASPAAPAAARRRCPRPPSDGTSRPRP